MDNLEFTEEEIQEQLCILGYRNIPKHRLREFKQDLDKLVRHGTSLSPSSHKSPSESPPSPTECTRDKGGRRCFNEGGEGFFLHPSKDDSERHVLGACQNPDPDRQPWDSYAGHSLAPVLQLPTGPPARLQAEHDPEGGAASPSLTDSSYATLPGHRLIKRKVLRKRDGRSLVCEESFYSQDTDVATSLLGRLEELALSPGTENEDVSVTLCSEEPEEEELEEDGAASMTRPERDDRPGPKSSVRPVMSKRTLKKTDPVNRYYEYKQFWDKFKPPGEADRRNIRWELKEQLAYQPPTPKPRRVYVPNTYIVPTEKKRPALRWEIQRKMANGVTTHNYRL